MVRVRVRSQITVKRVVSLVSMVRSAKLSASLNIEAKSRVHSGAATSAVQTLERLGEFCPQSQYFFKKISDVPLPHRFGNRKKH